MDNRRNTKYNKRTPTKKQKQKQKGFIPTPNREIRHKLRVVNENKWMEKKCAIREVQEKHNSLNIFKEI